MTETTAAAKKKPKKNSTAILSARISENESMIREVNDNVGQLGDAIHSISERLEIIFSAKEAPAVGRSTIEPMEMQHGEPGAAEVKVGDTVGDVSLIKPQLGSVNDPLMAEKIKMEAFMQERVRVFIQDTGEENAQQVFSIGVNGVLEIFRRGEEKTVARCFVEGLARARPVHYENQEFTQDDGARAFKYPSRQGLRFPFSVVDDPNPLGQQWLAHVLKQP